MTAGGDAREPVAVRVFNDRLQNHGGHEGVVQLRVDAQLLLDSACVASVLHGEIHLNELHLITERDELSFSALEGDTQETAELFQHEVSGGDVNAHEAGDAVHG